MNHGPNSRKKRFDMYVWREKMAIPYGFLSGSQSFYSTVLRNHMHLFLQELGPRIVFCFVKSKKTNHSSQLQVSVAELAQKYMNLRVKVIMVV